MEDGTYSTYSDVFLYIMHSTGAYLLFANVQYRYPAYSNVLQVWRTFLLFSVLVPTYSVLAGVEETVLALLRQYNAFHELKGRNLTCDR